MQKESNRHLHLNERAKDYEDIEMDILEIIKIS
jgi:hypothetical protein